MTFWDRFNPLNRNNATSPFSSTLNGIAMPGFGAFGLFGGQNGGSQNGSPIYQEAMDKFPGYSGPESLDPQFQLDPGSRWERNMLGKQDLESQKAMDTLNSANSSNWATARSNMAMRGGIDQGARERLASNAAKSGMLGAQEQSRLNQMANLDIGAKAEDRSIDANKFNIKNSIDQGMGRNSYNLGRYQSDMQAMAAEREAQSVENSAKKGFPGMPNFGGGGGGGGGPLQGIPGVPSK